MRDTIDMANETLDKMAPDDYCRESYWTATDEELKAFEALVRADAFERIAEKVKEMPWETDTKDSFLIWLEKQK